MNFYRLCHTQVLPISLEEAWDFFSSPKNLATITPDELNFTVTSDLPDKMYEGQIITYTIKPLMGISVKWMTEIKHVEHLKYFVDEQRFGPYKFWHHLHKFKEIANGVEMQDVVHYMLPFGPIGALAHALVFRKKLENIFGYREKVLNALYSQPVSMNEVSR